MTLRVLLMEDDLELGQAVARTLTGSCAVELALTVDEALVALTARPFDVVLSDYHLGGENAEALLAAVADRYPSLRRVLHSSGGPKLPSGC